MSKPGFKSSDRSCCSRVLNQLLPVEQTLDVVLGEYGE